MKLEITAKDVIHSFWVPEFSQKQDAVPGQHNSLVITPTHLGTFPVICTELCGLGHALMRSHADVVTPAKFADVHEERRQRRTARARRLPAERLRQLPHVQACRTRPARSARISTT